MSNHLLDVLVKVRRKIGELGKEKRNCDGKREGKMQKRGRVHRNRRLLLKMLSRKKESWRSSDCWNVEF